MALAAIAHLSACCPAARFGWQPGRQARQAARLLHWFAGQHRQAAAAPTCTSVTRPLASLLNLVHVTGYAYLLEEGGSWKEEAVE